VQNWEHLFAFARNGTVYRDEPIDDGATVTGPQLPMVVQKYISERGRSDGYEFCGSYPEEDGLIMVMKRQRDQKGEHSVLFTGH
jgi:hypothetical protein